MSSSTTTITTVSIPDGKDEDFLTLAEVAAILRVPVNTLRWWRQCGDGPASSRSAATSSPRSATSGLDQRAEGSRRP